MAFDAIFLDLYGVLIDGRRVNAAYARRQAGLLRAALGGTDEEWTAGHDDAFAWYTRTAEDPAFWRGDYRERLRALETGYMERLFAAVGRSPPDEHSAIVLPFAPPNLGTSERREAGDLFALSVGLDYEVMRGIDGAFPEAKRLVPRLAKEYRLFAATNANRLHARAVLETSGLLGWFERVLTAEEMGGRKAGERFWTQAFEVASVSPATSVVVDDRWHYLRAAAALGATTVLVAAEEPGTAEGYVPDHVIRDTLYLPELLDAARRS